MEKQEQLFGRTEGLSVERPADTLRRRLLIEQHLPYSGKKSLGTDMLEPVAHWPEKDYPSAAKSSPDSSIILESDKPLRLSFLQALQIGANNSAEYQSKKEDVFRSALDLDLRRREFDFTRGAQAESSFSIDKSQGNSSGSNAIKGFEHGGSFNLNRTFSQGSKLIAALTIDLVNLLTPGDISSLGVAVDTSISIPLLRGAGKHIVAEPLTRAERDVVYAIYGFERYKKAFAVDIARSYLEALKQLNQADNAAENYRNLIISARRMRSLADAGRATEIDVDQAVQRELTARSRWISAGEMYKSRLDSFKKLIGLPPDAAIELDKSELTGLSPPPPEPDRSPDIKRTPSGDVAVELADPGRENAGPMEMDETSAITLGFENRLDLRVFEGKVIDAQRAVVVQADALGAELTLFGKTRLGGSRSLSTAGLDDASLRTGRGIYTGLLTLDLPFERTAERNAYRDSFIALERSVRDLQGMEDDIKLSIRSSLREMSEARENLQIQSKSVSVAEKRVKSTNMFLEAGRATAPRSPGRTGGTAYVQKCLDGSSGGLPGRRA